MELLGGRFYIRVIRAVDLQSRMYHYLATYSWWEQSCHIVFIYLFPSRQKSCHLRTWNTILETHKRKFLLHPSLLHQFQVRYQYFSLHENKHGTIRFATGSDKQSSMRVCQGGNERRPMLALEALILRTSAGVSVKPAQKTAIPQFLNSTASSLVKTSQNITH